MSPTSSTPTRPDAPSVMASIDHIADVLAAGAREAERLGRLGHGAVRALEATDLFRTWWPAELGGLDASVRQGIEVIEAVTAIDTSAGWNLGVCTLGSGMAGAYLADEAVDTIFADDLPLVAGQTAPVGQARPVDDGLVVSGRWCFGSGIHLASWVKAGVLIERDGEAPEAAIVVVPAEAVTIDEGSWDVAGLAGSGSYDYTMDGVHVPAGYWFRFPVAERRRGGPSFRLPVPGQVVILHAGFALGVARRCLDEIVDLARSKTRQFDTATIANRPNFRFDLAEKHAAVAAARVYILDVADRLVVAAGSPAAIPLLAEMRAAARYVNDIALDVATWAYRQGGGTALRRDHPLQRLLRDELAATQHVFVDDRAYTDHGGSLIAVDQA